MLMMEGRKEALWLWWWWATTELGPRAPTIPWLWLLSEPPLASSASPPPPPPKPTDTFPLFPPCEPHRIPSGYTLLGNASLYKTPTFPFNTFSVSVRLWGKKGDYYLGPICGGVLGPSPPTLTWFTLLQLPLPCPPLHKDIDTIIRFENHKVGFLMRFLL